MRQEVGDRLVRFWIGAAINARERVGRIIVDGFSEPMSAALRSAVHHHWLMHDGAGEIISNARDRMLTMSVLRGLMKKELNRFPFYHSLQPAISESGDEAFAAILERLRQCDPGTEQYEGVVNLPANFKQGSVSREVALEAATDATLPKELRLLAFYIAGAPLGEVGLATVHEVLAEEDSPSTWTATRTLAFHPERSAEFFSFLRNEEISLERRCKVAECFTTMFPEESARSKFIQEVLIANDLAPKIVDIIHVFAARYGNTEIFQALVERIPESPINIAITSISLFGHFPDRALAERAANLAQMRGSSAADVVRFASAAITGMLYILEMDVGLGGVLRYTMPHAGARRWMEVVEEWSDRDDVNIVQRLDLLTCGSRLGSARSRSQLQLEVLSLTNLDAAVFDEDNYGNVISSAIREACRRGPLLPLVLAERFVRSKRPNVPQVGVAAIEAYSTREALLLLVRLHGEITDWFLRSTLEGAIESLAARLGVMVRRDGECLSIPFSH